MNIFFQSSEGIFIDNNMLQWYRRCPQYAFFRGTKHLVLTKHTPATYFGTKWHECMYMLRGRHDQEPWSLQRAYQVVADYDVSMEQEEKGKTKARLCGALDEYYGYRDLGTSLDYKQDALGSQVIMAEEFLIQPIAEMANIPIYYCGLVDLVYQSDGEIFLMDYKTTSWNRIMDEVWMLSPQFLGYMWLFNKTAPSLKTNNFVLDLFMMQSKQNNKFLRRKMVFEDWMLEEWERDRVHEIRRILHDGQPTKNPSCSDYGGCPYYQLCVQPPEIRDSMAEQLYYIDEWDIHGKLSNENED